MELTESRNAGTIESYNSEIKYNVDGSCTCGRRCITIPYNDLLYIVKNEDVINLSDLKELEIQPDVNLYDGYYDNWLSDDGMQTVISDLNDSLEGVINKISEDGGVDIKELIKDREVFFNIIEKLGFVEISSHIIGSYRSRDNKISFHIGNVDYKNKKITITYNGKNHNIPWDNLSDWVLGGVLDLNESVKYSKRLLKESVEDITKISIFDFDGTLMRTPHPEEGKKEWEDFYDKKYPHIGWWSKPESLDDAVFNIEPIVSTVEDYKLEMKDPNTLVIMLTGRLPHQDDQIKELLSMNNIFFSEYHYKEAGNTLSSKLNTITTLMDRYPQVNSIEMWEDREPHASSFQEWGMKNNVNVKVNLVK